MRGDTGFPQRGGGQRLARGVEQGEEAARQPIHSAVHETFSDDVAACSDVLAGGTRYRGSMQCWLLIGQGEMDGPPPLPTQSCTEYYYLKVK